MSNKHRRVVEDMLSPELLVSLKILELEKTGEIPYYSRLCEVLEGYISKVTISKSLDNLNDITMLEREWVQNKKGRWVLNLILHTALREIVEAIDKHTDAMEKHYRKSKTGAKK